RIAKHAIVRQNLSRRPTPRLKAGGTFPAPNAMPKFVFVYIVGPILDLFVDESFRRLVKFASGQKPFTNRGRPIQEIFIPFIGPFPATSRVNIAPVGFLDLPMALFHLCGS